MGLGDAVRYVGVDERRARLGLRQQLAVEARVGTPEEVGGALVALHGSDPATVYLAVGARLVDASGTVGETERALYEDRTLVRMHGMRHTVFAFPTELTAVVHASTGLTVAARERASLIKDMAKAGAPDAAWLKEVEESALGPWDITRTQEAAAKELGLKEWARDESSRDRWITALAEHPKLIQRPIITADDGSAVVARSEDAVRDALARK